MLKKRVIPTLLLNGNRVVKGKNFSSYIDTGDPVTTFRVLNAQDSDELVFIDISEKTNESYLPQILKLAASECFMPLTIGGYLNDIEHMRSLLRSGADKLLITTSCFKNPSIVQAAVKEFGSQCIVAGIDYMLTDSARKVFIDKGLTDIDIEVESYIEKIIDLGIGEIFFNSISHDGNMNGCDLPLLEYLSKRLSVPFIYSGGVGNLQHLEEALEFADAISCGSFFLLSDNSPMRTRSYLRNKDFPIRRLK